MTAQTATTAEIAAALNTTPRELRKFLRADAKATNKVESLPGKGSRYELKSDKQTIARMTKRFNAWSASQAEARKAAKDVKVEEVDNSVDEVEVPDSLPGDEEGEMNDEDIDLDSLDDSIDD